LHIVSAQDAPAIERRLGDDPWVPARMLVTASAEPWTVLLGGFTEGGTSARGELVQLLTERLCLRRYNTGEGAKVHRLFGDALVMRYYDGVYDRDKSQRVLDATLGAYRAHGYSMLAVERRSDGEFLGQVGLLHWADVDGRADVEVAYMLLPEHWGQGYATEAARACRDWAFENLGVDRVVSFIDVENEPSIDVAKRNAMSLTHRLEQNRFGHPINVYAVTRDDWNDVKKGAS
jgi:RimJ/RimL family protein N-acetyltransferase